MFEESVLNTFRDYYPVIEKETDFKRSIITPSFAEDYQFILKNYICLPIYLFFY